MQLTLTKLWKIHTQSQKFWDLGLIVIVVVVDTMVCVINQISNQHKKNYWSFTYFGWCYCPMMVLILIDKYNFWFKQHSSGSYIGTVKIQFCSMSIFWSSAGRQPDRCYVNIQHFICNQGNYQYIIQVRYYMTNIRNRCSNSTFTEKIEQTVLIMSIYREDKDNHKTSRPQGLIKAIFTAMSDKLRQYLF